MQDVPTTDDPMDPTKKPGEGGDDTGGGMGTTPPAGDDAGPGQAMPAGGDDQWPKPKPEEGGDQTAQ